MTQQEFFAILPDSLIEGLRAAVQHGFDHYTASYQSVADEHSSRSVASLIHDHICEQAKRELCGNDLTYKIYQQRNIFIFRDLLILTFKKFDEKLDSRNYPTVTSEKFTSQEDLEGIDSTLPRVEVGYVTDPAGAGINGIFAVYRTKVNGHKQIDWSANLSDPDEYRQQDIQLPKNA